MYECIETKRQAMEQERFGHLKSFLLLMQLAWWQQGYFLGISGNALYPSSTKRVEAFSQLLMLFLPR